MYLFNDYALILIKQNLLLSTYHRECRSSDPKTTLKIYYHVTSKTKEKEQNVLDNLY